MEKVLNLFKHQTHFCVLTSSFSLTVCFLNYALNLNAFCHQAHFSRHQSNSNLMIMMLSSNLSVSFNSPVCIRSGCFDVNLHQTLLFQNYAFGCLTDLLLNYIMNSLVSSAEHFYDDSFFFCLIASFLNMFLTSSIKTNLNAFCHKAHLSRHHSNSSFMMVSSIFQHISIQSI